MAGLSALRLNADWDNRTYLMGLGRERADTWLETNLDRLGRETTTSIRDKFLGPSRRCRRNREAK
jgi:hypothetical protein